jgi:hypothetical protein
MKKRIIRCMSWPIGLKLVFFWIVLDALVGTFQFLYWAKVTHEFFPHITLQGTYAFVAYAAVLLSLIFAMLFRRQVFVGINLAVAVIHMFVTLHWNAEVACDLLELFRSGASLSDCGIEQYTIWMGWNAFIFLAWALVFWYLMRYEVSIRKDETQMPNQVPEDTARKLADPLH